MKLNDVIEPTRVFTQCRLGSKKAILAKACEILALSSPELDEDVLAERFFSRERLGSTGVGFGVAIPHIRDQSVTEARACFLQLSEPVEYEAPDELPVDLIFALMVPEEETQEHLQLLSEVVKRFRDSEFRERIRELTDPIELYEFLTQHAYQFAAA